MLAQTIASYTKNNTNLKIGVQGATLFGTYKMIRVRRLRMTPTKSAKKVRMKQEEYHSRSGH
jgi:hypothetical protein